MKCVFWLPEEPTEWKIHGCTSIKHKLGVKKTECECNHLTVFTAFMDPHGSPVCCISYISNANFGENSPR